MHTRLADPASPAPARHRLGTSLRQHRRRQSIHIADAAAHLEIAPSTLSRIETGHAPIRPIYLAALLDLYGITDPARRAALAGLAREGRAKSWWAPYADLLPRSAARYLALESAATTVRSYHAHTIPGLLQTPRYAQAAAQAARPGLTPNQARRLAALQARRRAELLDHGTSRVHLIIDHAALTRPIVPAPAMATQISHITALAASPALTIQITGPAPPALSPSFTLLTIPGQPATACLPAPRGLVLTTTARPDIAALHATWQALARAALTPDAATALLDNLLDRQPAGPRRPEA